MRSANGLLLVAAGLIVALGAAHSYLGERYILIRLFRRPDLPHLFGSDVFTRRTLRLAWHLTTVVWWGVGAILIAAARAADGVLSLSAIGAVVAVTAVLSALVAFTVSRGRHLSWIVFLAVGVLAWFGTH